MPIGPNIGLLKVFNAVELDFVTSLAQFNSSFKQTKTPLPIASLDIAVQIEAAKLAGPS